MKIYQHLKTNLVHFSDFSYILWWLQNHKVTFHHLPSHRSNSTRKGRFGPKLEGTKGRYTLSNWLNLQPIPFSRSRVTISARYTMVRVLVISLGFCPLKPILNRFWKIKHVNISAFEDKSCPRLRFWLYPLVVTKSQSYVSPHTISSF